MMVSILACSLMFIDHRFGAEIYKIRALMAIAVYPIRNIVDLPIKASRSFGDFFVSHNKLLAENEAYKEEHLLLQGKLQRLEALEIENLHLRNLLESGSQVSTNVSIGNIINIAPDPFSQQIIINRGLKDGAYVGQVIIDADGIMGMIVAVAEEESKAILITDASHAVPVENARNGLRAIAVGTGSGGLELRHVPTNSDIQIGDKMTSSGLGGRFPIGFPVGIVKEIRSEPNKAFAKIILEPSAKLDRGRHVLLLQQTKRGKEKNQAKEQK